MNQTTIVKTSLNGTKILFWFKQMFNKNNFYLKATHYFKNEKISFPFWLKNATVKYQSKVKN